MTGALASINFDTDVYRRAVGSTISFITEARGTANVSTVTYTARAFVRSGAKCTIDDVCALIDKARARGGGRGGGRGGRRRRSGGGGP